MKQIQTILGYSKNDYKVLTLSVFLQWCDKYSNNQRELQHLMSYQPLLNWFKREFKQLESEFIDTTKPYIKKVDKATAFIYYTKVVTKIQDYFPSALFPDNHKFTSTHPVNFFETHKN